MRGYESQKRQSATVSADDAVTVLPVKQEGHTSEPNQDSVKESVSTQ